MKIFYDVNSTRVGPLVQDPQNHKHVFLDLSLAEMCKGANPGQMLSSNFKKWLPHLDHIELARSAGECYSKECKNGRAIRFKDLRVGEVKENFKKLIKKVVVNPQSLTPEELKSIKVSVSEQFAPEVANFLRTDKLIFSDALERFGVLKKFKKAPKDDESIVHLAVKSAELFIPAYLNSQNIHPAYIARLSNECSFHFISHCTSVIRALMWIRDGGLDNKPNHDVINEVTDSDWCALASYGNAVVTKDARNIETLRHLIKCIEFKSKKKKEFLIL